MDRDTFQNEQREKVRVREMESLWRGRKEEKEKVNGAEQ